MRKDLTSSNMSVDNSIEFSRTVYNDVEFRSKYKTKRIESGNIVKDGFRHFVKYYQPSGKCALNFFLDRLPFFKWITKYDIKQNIAPDLISGFTIGIVHIPQSMAYTMLSLLPAYIGLYVSIFPVLVYILLGTSRHLSMGTFAVPAIMTATALMKYEGVLYPASTGDGTLRNASLDLNQTTVLTTTVLTTTENNAHYLSNDPDTAKILIAMCLCFLTGIVQILFAVFHIGFVTKYLSDAIVAGFTTGAAYHIVVSQIASLLGYSVKKPKIAFKLVGSFIEIFKYITKTNLAAVIISIICIILLYLVKEQINHRFAKKMFMPVPIELLVVVFGTLFSYLFKFNEKWDVKIVGYVPKGLPVPKVPPLELIPKLIGDAIGIAIVTFAMNISMGKFFGKKYKYEISPNQELFAYGAGNVLSAFFHGYPSCVSLSRCAILEATNGKTQIYAIVSSILVIICCLFMGPLFYTLPQPCLAAIIVVALKGMMLQVLDIPSVYRTSKMEALAWVCTFLGVMILDVDIGLYIGIGFSLLLVIVKSQRPRVSILGNIPNTELYESIQICEDAFELNGIKIIRYEESIYYANVDNFKYQVMKCVGINMTELLNQLKKIEESEAKKAKKEKSKNKNELKKNESSNGIINGGFDNDMYANMEKGADTPNQKEILLNSLEIKHVIIDCSPFNFADSTGIDAILRLKDMYEQIGVTFHLANCKPDFLKMLKKKAFKDRFDYNFLYPTIHDAVCGISKTLVKTDIANLENGLKDSAIELSENMSSEMDYEIKGISRF